MNYKSLVGYEISRLIAEHVMDWYAHEGRWYSDTGPTHFLVARAIMDLPAQSYWRPDRDYKQGLTIVQRLADDYGAEHEYFHGNGKIECNIFTDKIKAKAREAWDINVGNEVLCDAALAFWKKANEAAI